MATGNTVAEFQGYPTLLSDNSELEIEMEGSSNPPMEYMAAVVQQILANQAVTDKRVADVEKKSTDKAFVKSWEESAIPETQDPIGRVIALLEIPKQEDSQGHYVNLLKAEIASGTAPLSTYAEFSKAEAAYKKILGEFNQFGPTYDGP